MAVKAPADEVHRVISTALDPAFYWTVYSDVAEAGADALSHYVQTGWREGRDPAPWFSTQAYLEADPDLAAEDLDPFFHFLTRGAREGRRPAPSPYAKAYFLRTGGGLGPWRVDAFLRGPAATLAGEPEPTPAPLDLGPAELEARDLVAEAFDAAYYLAAYPDIAEAKTDPLEHFLLTGWREGRNPTAWFSTEDYVEAHPDIAAAGVNPFWHYLAAGREEGRSARYDLGFRYAIVARSPPVERRLEASIAAARTVETQSAAVLARRLAAAKTGLKDVHVTFSHDDYTAVIGGLQLSLRRESARFRAMRIDHLHIHPAVFWPLVRNADEPGPVGVLLNGRSLGAYRPADVRTALRRAAEGVEPGRRSFAIHSLLGHAPDDAAKILEALGLKAGFFWLHDFASLCAGFHLVRNDVEDCAAPPPDSAACSICNYGGQRARHLDAHRRLFERLDLTVVAPSATTLDFWRASWSHPAKAATVLPHATLSDRGPAPRARRRRLRVAFLGLPVPVKGWPIFAELANRHADDPRYEFLHLGGRADPGAPAVFHPAVADADRPEAMREAIEALEVDVALVWPLCRETFSFTAYEAVAAGAAVLTNPDSGNVAAFVAETGQGRVLSSEAALAEAFASGEVQALARHRRKARLYDLAYSGLTADLVGATA